MKQPRFEIHRSKNKQFYFVLKSKNGKVIATGETYKSKQMVKKTITKIVEIVWDMAYEPSKIIDKTKAKK